MRDAAASLPGAALTALRAPLARRCVSELLRRGRDRRRLGQRLAALRAAFGGGVDDAALKSLDALDALRRLDGPRRRALGEAFRGLAPPEAHDSLEAAVAVAPPAVREQLAGMLEANGVDGLDLASAAALLSGDHDG